MPVYNRPHYTEIGLWALSRQTCKAFQVFLVNDGGDPQYLRKIETFHLPIHYRYIGPKTTAFRGDIGLNWVLQDTQFCGNRILRLDDDFIPDISMVEEHQRFGGTRNVVLNRYCGVPYRGDISWRNVEQHIQRATMTDVRFWQRGLHPYEFVSCWAGCISYPVEALQAVHGTRSCFLGCSVNADIDLAARLIHHAGCRAVYCSRTKAYTLAPFELSRHWLRYDKESIGPAYLLNSGKQGDYERSIEWMRRTLRFQLPTVDFQSIQESDAHVTWEGISSPPEVNRDSSRRGQIFHQTQYGRI